MEIIFFGQSPVTGLSEAERSYANWLYQSQSIKLYPHLKATEFIEVCLDFCNWNTAWKINWKKYPHNWWLLLKEAIGNSPSKIKASNLGPMCQSPAFSDSTQVAWS